MKTKKLMLAAIAICAMFTSCFEGANKTVSREYRIRVGLGTESALGTESPGLMTVFEAVEEAVEAINKAQAKIAVTGKGRSEEAALKDAVAKAMTIFDQQAEDVYVQLVNLQLKFKTECQQEASSIVLEKGFFLRLNAEVFLEDYEAPLGSSPEIIRQEGSYKMEAVGGTDYGI
jgi:hypothetical protein